MKERKDASDDIFLEISVYNLVRNPLNYWQNGVTDRP